MRPTAITRREALRSGIMLGGGMMGAAMLGGCLARPGLPGAGPVGSGTASLAGKGLLPRFYEVIERRTFDFFWQTANRANGLVPDRWPTRSFASIAGVGFALPAYAVGVERGWCPRGAARDLTLTTLRFLWSAPQGPDPSGTSGHKGFFYHFLDMETGRRFRQVELSTIDTALLLMGVLFAGRYFDRAHPAEREIRSLAAAIHARADWTFFQSDGRAHVAMGWHPETGLISHSWRGYNEAMIVYLLALSAPVHPIAGDGWRRWTESYPKCWRGQGAERHLAFAPLFGHQYSHVFVDFRGIRDEAMAAAGIDYFENSRRATIANRAYCAANHEGWAGYSDQIWGLTACDGPASVERPFGGRMRQFHSYAARGPLGQPDGLDDGTLAPTAALGSLPFAPDIVIPCARALMEHEGGWLMGRYGLLDSFNPSFRFGDVPLDTGRVDPERGWVARDHLAIDQGPILLQAANYRDGFVWNVLRGDPAIASGLRRAGFAGGWLDV